jgi:hypothetical protein
MSQPRIRRRESPESSKPAGSDLTETLHEILRTKVPFSIETRGDGCVRVKFGRYRTRPPRQAVTKTFDEAVRWLRDQLELQTDGRDG